MRRRRGRVRRRRGRRRKRGEDEAEEEAEGEEGEHEEEEGAGGGGKRRGGGKKEEGRGRRRRGEEEDDDDHGDDDEDTDHDDNDNGDIFYLLHIIVTPSYHKLLIERVPQSFTHTVINKRIRPHEKLKREKHIKLDLASSLNPARLINELLKDTCTVATSRAIPACR